MPRNHKYYPKSYIEEVMKYSRLFGHKSPRLVARNFSIPESTVRGWIRADTQGGSNILKVGLFLTYLTLSIPLFLGVGAGVCYLFGGQQEAAWFLQTWVDVFRFYWGK